MISPFFERDDFIINEKVEFLTFSNKYKVLDMEGNQIGFVGQIVPDLHKFLRLFLGKAMMPFEFNIEDASSNVLVKIKRGWTLLMSEIVIEDAAGTVLGYVKQKFSLITPRFEILDKDKNQIGTIKGNWTAWNFEIFDKEERTIGKINKKWAGAMKEFFTSADNYHVSIDQTVAEDQNKVAILTAAITIDMVLKEK